MGAEDLTDSTFRLRELTHAARDELALAAVALCAAVAATWWRPQLAVPLLIGGAVVGARGVVVVWRRWDLLDRLALERDAYAIPEVRLYASRNVSMETRRALASRLRAWGHEECLGGDEPGSSLVVA